MANDMIRVLFEDLSLVNELSKLFSNDGKIKLGRYVIVGNSDNKVNEKSFLIKKIKNQLFKAEDLINNFQIFFTDLNKVFIDFKNKGLNISLNFQSVINEFELLLGYVKEDIGSVSLSEFSVSEKISFSSDKYTLKDKENSVVFKFMDNLSDTLWLIYTYLKKNAIFENDKFYFLLVDVDICKVYYDISGVLDSVLKIYSELKLDDSKLQNSLENLDKKEQETLKFYINKFYENSINFRQIEHFLLTNKYLLEDYSYSQFDKLGHLSYVKKLHTYLIDLKSFYCEIDNFLWQNISQKKVFEIPNANFKYNFEQTLILFSSFINEVDVTFKEEASKKYKVDEKMIINSISDSNMELLISAGKFLNRLSLRLWQVVKFFKDNMEDVTYFNLKINGKLIKQFNVEELYSVLLNLYTELTEDYDELFKSMHTYSKENVFRMI